MEAKEIGRHSGGFDCFEVDSTEFSFIGQSTIVI